MTIDYDAMLDIANRELLHSARNLQHLLRVDQDTKTFQAVADSLNQTMIDAYGNNPMDICHKMTVQARIFDAMFQDYLTKARNCEPDQREAYIEKAIQCQKQMVRTMSAWKHLKIERYTKARLVKLYEQPKKRAERTEQTYEEETALWHSVHNNSAPDKS